MKLAPPRQGFFEEVEYLAVLKELPEYLKPLVEFLYWTGWRLMEGMTLQWSQVDFENGVVTLNAGETKTDAPRQFPFSALPPLEALLKRQREATTALERQYGQVIPSVFHRWGHPIRHFRGAWNAACKRAHLPGRLIHDFRRTAVQ